MTDPALSLTPARAPFPPAAPAMPFSQRLGLGSFGFPLPGQAPDPQWWTAINKLFLYSMESSQFQLKGVAPWFDPMPDVCMPAMDAGQDLRQINFLQLTELDLSGIFLLQIGGARPGERGARGSPGVCAPPRGGGLGGA